MNRAAFSSTMFKKQMALLDIICALLIIVFLYTALSKLITLGSFRYTLSKSVLLENYAGFLSLFIPLSEFVLVILLFVPGFRPMGLLGSALMLTAFTIYLVYMVTSSSDLPCSCGGVVSKLSWKQHIVFNTVLVGLSLLGLYLHRRIKLYKMPPAQDAAYL